MSKLQEFFSDLSDLYAWCDSVNQVSCPEGCNLCCCRDIIWMTLPELIRIHTKRPEIKIDSLRVGCPFRTETGCGVYEDRPLVCKSFGASQLAAQSVVNLYVNTPKGVRTVAGPGWCDNPSLTSRCDSEELRNIYRCYNALAADWGLVAVGSCDDLSLQHYQERILAGMQTRNSSYQVYARDGKPILRDAVLYAGFRNYFGEKALEGVLHV